MSFPYPRIFDIVTNGFWGITPGAFDGVLRALENAANGHFAAGIPAMPKAASGNYVIGDIGVISANGIIGKRLDSLETACGGLDINALVADTAAMADTPSVKTIIHDWNSPGGVVTGVPEAYAALVEIGKKKPIVSYTDMQRCSCAQWLSSAATSQYASASSQGGAVGVYNLILDRSKQLAQEGIKVDAIHAGKNKLMGAQFQPLSDEHRAMMQGKVDAIHAEFKAAVTRGRKVDPAALEGQSLNGKEALKAGMIDGIYPSLESLITALQKMGGQ